ncbi:MAG: glycosyltransferase family protein [Magnetococcales bacterium]|nr:glycosyltransferase family protein [Magnetococcales bacterium]
MKTIATIEARMSSTRLPGKVLRPILGRPMLQWLVERLQRAQTLDGVVVATTVNPADDPIAQLAERLGIGCFRGSEEDVLDRVLRTAQAHHADVIVELTGDNPLIDPRLVDHVVEIYRARGVDYVSNCMAKTYPLGMNVQVFSTAVLAETARSTDDPADHEHVSLYIYEHPERFSLHNVASGLAEEWSDVRLTVDTLEDFELVSRIVEALHPTQPDFGLPEILQLLEREPTLRAINAGVAQKKARE